MRHITRRSALLTGLAASALAASPSFADETPRAVTPPGMILGEGPIWSARDNALYWVDIRGQKLHRLNFKDNSQQSWDTPGIIPWIVERKSGGFLVAILRTVHALTLDPFTLTPLFSIDGDLTTVRLNDAKVDPAGRLWTGTMDLAFKNRIAALYRIDPDLSVHQMDTGYICTNGPAFSRDGRIMYHNETHDGIVYAYDLAADGSISHKRIFAKFPDGVGLPDGCTTDADDGLWVSHYGGGRVSRYRPDGVLDFDVMVPAKQSTSLSFAGPNLDRLFVTTAAQPPVDADDKLAGTLFEIPSSSIRGHKGLPMGIFAG
ncbi:SMP-30/gluconolactonase/LRE family protein [Asticcacaulis sp. EMRT-3]|uniref:SMP-30/gluconolactonase/LRE family protein n=1 Tax=Asticcacaulis sp. EMRT-3 TaxID=3040349 RepID=UPI0024AF1042|nr:SMP-30/gluconolactonase/LRE family protein [Asticcacaulis sp. EMRT-3]MDI7773818.1 SMP-30/gluconolactonase/LRE family protein [Asticcacaulis sp. EMRT-3]